jgi:hypothetical protein
MGIREMTISGLTKKGFILLSVVSISMVFIVLIIPLVGWAVNEFSWTVRSFMSLRALNLADAGAEEAAWNVIHNSAQFTGWSGTNPKTLNLPNFTDNLGESIGDIEISALTTSPDNYLVTSNGYVPNKIKPKAKKTVKIKIFPHALFNNGLFGNSAITMVGITKVDSYDSSAGPYSISTSGSNGDIGTNGTLSLSGGAIVHGDALIGPDGNTSGVDSSNVTGEIFYSGNTIELDPVILPVLFTGLPNLGLLQVKAGGGAGGGDVTIPTGNYTYNNIDVTGSKLIINANTNIYVISDFSVSGAAAIEAHPGVVIYIGGEGKFAGQGILNTSGIPGNLQIYGLGSASSISYTGGSSFYGTIYAPTVSVATSGGADIFGAIVGNNINISGNGAFHYDESLSRNGPFSGYDIAYWQED